MGTFAFEKGASEMAKQVRKGDIIVAGPQLSDAGRAGSTHPGPWLQLGISCVVAESYARIFLPQLHQHRAASRGCQVEADDGDELSVDLSKGVIVNHTKGKEWKFAPFPKFVQELMDKGGLMAKIKEEKRCTR